MSQKILEVTMSGWVGSDPKTYYADPAGGGKQFCTFPLIHSPLYRDAEGNWRRGEKMSVVVKATGVTAEHVSASVRVGQPMVVHGMLSQNQWTDAEGGVHRRLQIFADTLGHDLSWGESAFTRKKFARQNGAEEEAEPWRPSMEGAQVEEMESEALGS